MGVWEYWNVGTIDDGIVEFAKQSKWPFPSDVSTIIGKNSALMTGSSRREPLNN